MKQSSWRKVKAKRKQKAGWRSAIANMKAFGEVAAKAFGMRYDRKE